MNGQVGQLGKNSAEEFFETIIMMVGYEESKKIIHEFTKDVDNPIFKEAIESSMNVLVMGVIMYAVRAQESLISKVFDLAEALFTVLILDAGKKALNRLSKFKGMKFLSRMKLFQNSNQENLMTAQIVATHQGFKSSAKASVSSPSSQASAYQLQLDTKNSLYQREQLHMNMGNNMASRYNETLLFKLFTKSFTKNDKTLLNKILGRDSTSLINVEDVNQIADFLFVKDSNGKPVGLTEACYQLLNGLGYLHNK